MPFSVHEADFRLAAAWSPSENMTMEKILVPVDFSDESGQLLAAAEEAARTRGSSLLLLHVVEPVPDTAGIGMDPSMTPLPSVQNFEAEEKIEAERLRKLAAGLEARGIPCSIEVRLGLPADEILDAAAEYAAGLVVMGSHGHGALFHLFTGSAVTGVLRRIECPVLVVPLRRKKE